jgi:hypothetical protein
MADSLPLRTFLASVRPGSQDPPWTWHDESRDLWTREPDPMLALVADIKANGQLEPVMVGDDGRLWDGHHRVAALMDLEADEVLFIDAETLRVWPVPEGRWGIAQLLSDDVWTSTGSLGYERREDADAHVARRNGMQPGRFRVRDRRPVTEETR